MGGIFSTLSANLSLPLVVCIGVPVIAGSIIGSLCFEDQVTWYKTLSRPWWEPPSFVFGQVWALLYALMGYASYLVFFRSAAEPALRRHALKLYVVQLVLNLAWQPLFFKAKKLGTAQFENLALLGAATATMGAFYKVEHFAGSLMLPYVIWVAFANLLNFAVWKKNPNATRILEPLRDTAPNPGEAGYGGSNARAALAQPTSGRSRKQLVVFSGMARPTAVQHTPLRTPRSLPMGRPSRVTMPRASAVRSFASVATAPRAVFV